jgi:hypothetical protein
VVSARRKQKTGRRILVVDDNLVKPLDPTMFERLIASSRKKKPSSVMQKSPNETLRPWSNCATIS